MGVCCCLQICNSVINMVVKGLAKFDSHIYPVMQNYLYYVLGGLLFICKVNCLQTCKHISAHWAIKVCVFVKFHIRTYLLWCLRY